MMNDNLFAKTLRRTKRPIVAVVGFTVLLIGVLMLVLPGPAFIIIPIGLAILATEFIWARKLLAKVKNTIQRSMKGGNNHEAK